MPSVFCVKGRINTGSLKATVNSKCCKTDLCNDQPMPALQKQSANEKKCCANSGCSETVTCEGDEDRCMNGSVYIHAFQMSLKGCASRSICDGLIPLHQHFNMTADVQCCEGNLCNGLSNAARSTDLLIMLGSLLSFIYLL
ncbi:hypothetical protein NFI96_018200 [Prochilodus magdalenae]|nr:hypothetical protein NFI96_018200 [Prochilodus magdalenae]